MLLQNTLPFLAKLTIWSMMDFDESVNHLGAFRLYGSAEPEIPFPFPLDYMRPIIYLRFNFILNFPILN